MWWRLIRSCSHQCFLRTLQCDSYGKQIDLPVSDRASWNWASYLAKNSGVERLFILGHLHVAIQDVMGWLDYHLHEILLEGILIADSSMKVSRLYYRGACLPARRLRWCSWLWTIAQSSRFAQDHWVQGNGRVAERTREELLSIQARLLWPEGSAVLESSEAPPYGLRRAWIATADWRRGQPRSTDAVRLRVFAAGLFAWGDVKFSVRCDCLQAADYFAC